MTDEGVNKIFLLGNVGQKPELRYTNRGDPYCKFSIATSERMPKTDTGQKREHTEWHRCTAWGKTAEIIEKWVGKGAKLHIEGKIRYGDYVNKDKITVNTCDIHVDQFQIVVWGKKETSTSTQQSAGTQAPPPGSGDSPGNAPPPTQTEKSPYESSEINLDEDSEF